LPHSKDSVHVNRVEAGRIILSSAQLLQIDEDERATSKLDLSPTFKWINDGPLFSFFNMIYIILALWHNKFPTCRNERIFGYKILIMELSYER
jgi:hypothetical protein